MTKEDLEQMLNEALSKLAQLQAVYDAAHKELLDEYERDSHRGDGSGAQERRREEHQQELRNSEWAAKQALEAQKAVVLQLQQQLELIK